MTAFLGVALLGVLPGIVVAVVLSVVNVFRRVWWPYQHRWAGSPASPGCTTYACYPEAERRWPVPRSSASTRR